MKLTNEELCCVVGGAFTVSLITALTSALNKFYQIGRAIGTALKRTYKKNYC